MFSKYFGKTESDEEMKIQCLILGHDWKIGEGNILPLYNPTYYLGHWNDVCLRCGKKEMHFR